MRCSSLRELQPLFHNILNMEAIGVGLSLGSRNQHWRCLGIVSRWRQTPSNRNLFYVPPYCPASLVVWLEKKAECTGLHRRVFTLIYRLNRSFPEIRYHTAFSILQDLVFTFRRSQKDESNDLKLVRHALRLHTRNRCKWPHLHHLSS